MNARQEYEIREKGMLAPYAQTSMGSLGRRHPEPECEFRACFYRDLGRIVHSTAFRLLEYKTQVFVNHEGDYYRTRLTHTLEVSQISRGVARIIRCNEDLAHTIALAHDLGHAPFGHPGEGVLNELMKDEGGFEHNFQGYRVVTKLEDRYPDFRGLNLSYEVLEGIIRHCTDYDSPIKAADFREVGYPTLEAQIVNRADEIAFMNHDLDDGLHWGMLSMETLNEVPLWEETYRKVQRNIPAAPDRIKRCRTISDLIGRLISDLQAETRRRIDLHGIRTLDDVRAKGNDIVSFSDDVKCRTEEAKNFLYGNVYHHEKVVKMSNRAKEIISDLFEGYLADPSKMPEKFYKRYLSDKSKRHICDYIAGMTDRYAIDQHKKLI